MDPDAAPPESRRRLSEEYHEDGEISKIYGKPSDGEYLEGLDMYILLGDMSDPEQLKFNYTVVDFNKESLSMQLLFENPGYVSASIDPEHLMIVLAGFRDKDGKLIVES